MTDKTLTIPFTLTDVDPPELMDPALADHPYGLLPGKVTIDPRGIGIRLKTYGNATEAGGEIAWLELAGDVPRLHLWTDINREDPTHSIELTGAAESFYEPTRLEALAGQHPGEADEEYLDHRPMLEIGPDLNTLLEIARFTLTEGLLVWYRTDAALDLSDDELDRLEQVVNAYMGE